MGGILEMAVEDKKIIMVVEDDAQVRNVATLGLEQIGFHVLAASNGSEAVDLFNEWYTTLALVILDMNMPVMGGREALAKMREVSADVPILISSGSNESESLNDQENAQIDGILPKPYSLDQLKSVIRSTIGE